MLENLDAIRRDLGSALEPLNLIVENWLSSESPTSVLQLRGKYDLGEPEHVFNIGGAQLVQVEIEEGHRVIKPTILGLLASKKRHELGEIFVQLMVTVIEMAKASELKKTNADAIEIENDSALSRHQLTTLRVMLSVFWPGGSPVYLSGWNTGGDFSLKWDEKLLPWLKTRDVRKQFEELVSGTLLWRPRTVASWQSSELRNRNTSRQDVNMTQKESRGWIADDDARPSAFISYSWDDKDHEAWVEGLAGRLRDAGIHVKIDKWDIGPGDHIPRYMGRSVRESDFVLVVCTEKYVSKANAGAGGAGYELNIVTAELVRDQDLNHFIPLIRPPNRQATLPDALLNRYYIDFRDDSRFEQNLSSLVARLRTGKPISTSAPVPDKRLKGVGQHASAEVTPAVPDKTHTSIGSVLMRAEPIILSSDKLGWHKLIAEVRKTRDEASAIWLREHPRAALTFAAMVEDSFAGIGTFREVIALCLAGAASRSEDFVNQPALVHTILTPANWPSNGSVPIIALPRLALFAAQAAHGSLAMQLGKPALAFKFAAQSVPAFPTAIQEPLWRQDDLIGWPHPLNRDSQAGWTMLLRLYEDFGLQDFFAEEEDYQAALVAYYSLLNLIEFAWRAKNGETEQFGGARGGIFVPLNFARCGDTVARRARIVLLESPAALRTLLKEHDLTDAAIAQYWQSWLNVCQEVTRNERYFAVAGMPHANLFNDLGPLNN